MRLTRYLSLFVSASLSLSVCECVCLSLTHIQTHRQTHTLGLFVCLCASFDLIMNIDCCSSFFVLLPCVFVLLKYVLSVNNPSSGITLSVFLSLLVRLYQMVGLFLKRLTNAVGNSFDPIDPQSYPPTGTFLISLFKNIAKLLAVSDLVIKCSF